MPETLGARLRQRREERGIALVTIAQQTKIKQALLDGLEQDDLSHWPSSLYRRAFVKAYAGAIGLDPEKVVHEFLQAHPDPPEVDVLAAMASTLDRNDGQARRSNGFRRVVGSAFESLARRPRPAVVDDRRISVTVSASPVPPSQPAPEVTPSPAVVAESPAAPAAPDKTSNDGGTESEFDLLAVAGLCTEFSRVDEVAAIAPLLGQAGTLLNAKGLIVWVWDTAAERLKPALVHGYSDRLVSQLPLVARDADNATAAAFRSAEPRALRDCGHACAAVVVPLLTAAGCAGVLAVELLPGRAGTKSVVALATILAAHLAPISPHMLTVAAPPPARLTASGPIPSV